MDTLAGAAMPPPLDDDETTGRSFALLNQAERDRLAVLMRPLPWIDGLIAATVIAPDTAPDAAEASPDGLDGSDEIEGALDWLDFIWSEQSEDELEQLPLPESLEAVMPAMDHYCHVANALFDAPDTYRPYLAGPDSLAAAAQWADGFRIGISLAPEAWAPLFADEDALSLLVVIFSLLRDEDMPEEMKAESPFRDMPADRREHMRRSAVEMLPQIVVALHDHALGQDGGDGEDDDEK
jgi:yecA family protein